MISIIAPLSVRSNAAVYDQSRRVIRELRILACGPPRNRNHLRSTEHTATPQSQEAFFVICNREQLRCGVPVSSRGKAAVGLQAAPEHNAASDLPPVGFPHGAGRSAPPPSLASGASYSTGRR